MIHCCSPSQQENMKGEQGERLLTRTPQKVGGEIYIGMKEEEEECFFFLYTQWYRIRGA